MFKPSQLKGLNIALTASLVALSVAGPVAAATASCPAPAANNVISTISNINQPVAVAEDPSRGVVYVPNFTASTVSVIAEATGGLITTIPVGSYPYAIAIDTFHGKVYVTNYLGKSVSVIDETTNTVTDTITGIAGAPHGIAVDPVRGKVYTVGTSGLLQVIDTTSNTIVGSLKLPVSTSDIKVDPITGTLYAGLDGGGLTGIDVINPTTLTITANVPLSTEQILFMAIDPIGHKLYVPGSNAYDESPTGAGSVFVIDTLTNTLISSIRTIANDTPWVAFDPISQTIYATSLDYNSYIGGVMVIDAKTNTVTDTIPMNDVQGLALDTMGRTLYVSLSGQSANTINVISTGGTTCPSDVSAQTSVKGTGFLYSRKTGLYSGSLTITNNGAAITDPITIALDNLPADIQPIAPIGSYNTAPVYLGSASGLAAGASVTIPLYFSNPSNAAITFTPVTLQQ